MLRSLVRLLAVRNRRRHNWQQRQRRRTLSETLQRGPNNNAAISTCGVVVHGIDVAGVTVTVRSGSAVTERPDGLELNCKLRKQNFMSDNLARDILEDEEESSDVLVDPFTPSTEELPVCKIFVDSGSASHRQFQTHRE
jgi:hypothetical protein